MEYKPWFDFIVPGHKKCIPDTKKAEKLEIMIDVALDLLRSKNAAIQCGQNPNDEESGIKLNDLHDLLLSMKAPYITIDEFEELWDRSVIELEKEPDIIVKASTIRFFLRNIKLNNDHILTSIFRRDKQMLQPANLHLTLTTLKRKSKTNTKFFDQRHYLTLV